MDTDRETQCKINRKRIASITSEKEIKAHIIGADYSDDNVFTIDIQESKGLPTGLYVNDLENQLIGNTAGLEWKYKEEDQWTSYKEEQPDLSGDKTLIVRTAATGVYLAGTTNTYQFTKDNTDDAQKYISIKHLSIEKVSSEQSDKGDYAKNAIDGNINTLWHTVYDGSDKEKSITIKLDEPVYLSVLEYVPRQVGTNGRIKDAILYVSDDGEEWTEAASISGWLNNAQSKRSYYKIL